MPTVKECARAAYSLRKRRSSCPGTEPAPRACPSGHAPGKSAPPCGTALFDHDDRGSAHAPPVPVWRAVTPGAELHFPASHARLGERDRRRPLCLAVSPPSTVVRPPVIGKSEPRHILDLE